MNPKEELEQYEATEGQEIVSLLEALSPRKEMFAPLTFKAEVLARLDEKLAQQNQTSVVTLNTKKASNTQADLQPYFETSFLAMAAADHQTTIAGERKDPSGEWIIRIFTDRDDPNAGYVLLEVCKERAAEFEGKTVTLTIGEQELLASAIHDGEAAKEVTLEGLQSDAPWNIQIE